MPRLLPGEKRKLSDHASALGSHGAKTLWAKKTSNVDRAKQTENARLALARKITEKRAPVVVSDMDDGEEAE